MNRIQITLPILIIINVCNAQVAKQIYSDTSIIYSGIESIYYPNDSSYIQISITDPDTGEYSKHSNLTDEVNGIFYEFTYEDTIQQFVHSSDSTFYFRQFINDTLNTRGNFIRETKSYQFEKCNLGEYLSELVIVKWDVLKMSGEWYFAENNLYGKYTNGIRDGEWRTFYWDKEVEDRFRSETIFNYKMNELQHIINPSNAAVKKNYTWVENSALNIRLNPSENMSETDTIVVHRNIEDYIKEKVDSKYSNSINWKNIDSNSWNFNEFRGIDILKDSNRITYRIVFIDGDVMKLKKLVKASR